MQAKEIRQRFFDFFRSKDHKIWPSAPMVIKNDPSLMFTNAGMNQFKDIFLDNKEPDFPRIADTQKCLRVSGKHNDLEQVGHDTYHHTMFEMLGNWSFGDYFKNEAIAWAWELLTKEYKIPEDSLYVTVFEGDEKDNTDVDQEAFDIWKTHVPDETHILYGDKKDNFWEMGDTGPCGPCSEIHIDLRTDEEKEKTPGKDLVNKDHPLVVEIWNLVFIQYNRKADGSLENLPNKHIDTGMGFERLVMALQNKTSNYDTDVFQPLIQAIAKKGGVKYGEEEKADVALRVVADHIRAISFAIADGQLPSNVKAGYVIRRILRRAVRYGYTFLGFRQAFMHEFVPILVEQMKDVFPEIENQQTLITKVMKEEEESFLRTLDTGILMLNKLMNAAEKANQDTISGKDVFVLYDTYGFPFDLTRLILSENNFSVNEKEFYKELEKQKDRSRKASAQQMSDWTNVREGQQSIFVGYDNMEAEAHILKYRKVDTKKETFYQVVLDKTPFYPEAGGQVGDSGVLRQNQQKTPVRKTIKENELIIHICDTLPEDVEKPVYAEVNDSKRRDAANNHSATHLMHNALREVLGSHVEQKGSLVHPDYLRFDFSHFEKVSEEEIRKIERIVNQKIRANVSLQEHREVSMEEAQQMGAMALFGEKYGDRVRVIKFGDSIELCGGTHVSATGDIGFFKITTETSVAAGIRRIEAITAAKAEEWVYEQETIVKSLKEILRNPKDPVKGAKTLIEQQTKLEKKLEELKKQQIDQLSAELEQSAEVINGMNFISKKLQVDTSIIKDLAFRLKQKMDNLFIVLGAEDTSSGKATISVMISEHLVQEKDLHAGNIVKDLAKEINGNGGGQPFFATAGGKDPGGLEKALKKARNYLS
ncbi:MAG: alanine--tRNA ligase [Bacteroidales bacterium]|nr:alanine--tRNA ligase [Bacteroidales bacterium]MCF8327728.1 alanine--tRNA ligase [Bacteroidales bacterium]